MTPQRASAVGVLTALVSGGQTGVDRAALDVALEVGLACGGWCPRGRLAEDGRIDDRYPLRETDSANYAQRTEANVRDSDATLILTAGEVRGGTALTRQLAWQLGRPCLVVDLSVRNDPAAAIAWLCDAGVRVLNVAGPRESQSPGISRRTREFLRRLIEATRASTS